MLARAREKGLGADDAARARARRRRAGVRRGRAASSTSTSPILDSQGATRLRRPDPPRRRSRPTAGPRRAAARLRHVFVDEYQDTDPGQVALLQALAGDGRDLVVVGDPHQSIYAFRGAEVRGILEFPAEFPQRRRRAGPGGRAAARPALRAAAAARRRSGSPRRLAQHRRLDAATRGGVPPTRRPTGRPRPRADRGPHLRHRPRRGRAPRRPAPPGPPRGRHRLVRHGGAGPLRAAPIPPLRRALVAAGVPVEVASDDTPLVARAGGAAAARRAARRRRPRRRRPRHRRLRRRRPGRGLLLSPLGGLDAGDVRALARRCAHREQDAGRAPRSGRRARRRELLRRACSTRGVPRRARRARGRARRPRALAEPARARAARRARRRRARPRRCCGRCGRGTSLAASGCGARSTLGAAAPARRAHRDLDAVCALFDVGRPRRGAARPPRRPRASSTTLRGPADPRRHAGRARGPRRRGPAADRPPRQGARVAARRRRPRPGGRLARPAPPVDPAAAPTGSAADGAGAAGRRPGRAARRGAPALLRRLHPGPRSGSSSPPSRRPTTRASSRRGSSTSSGVDAERTSTAGRRGRCRWPGWSPSSGVPSPTPRQPEPLREAAAPPAGPARRRDAPATGRWCRRPTRRRWWGTRAVSPVGAAGARPATSRCRSRRAC